MSIYHEPFCGGKCLHRHWEKKRWKSLWIKENRWYTCCHFPYFPISKSSLVRLHASLYTFTTIIQCMWRKEKRSITKYILHLLLPLTNFIHYISSNTTRRHHLFHLCVCDFQTVNQAFLLAWHTPLLLNRMSLMRLKEALWGDADIFCHCTIFFVKSHIKWPTVKLVHTFFAI